MLFRSDFPLALSKGQRLRVILGALLAREPLLLLLDEPTTGQDQQSLLEIKKMIKCFAKENGTVLFCTHDIELASELADRVILMADGEIIADGNPEIILSNRDYLKKSGLNSLPILDIADFLGLKNIITIEELKKNVSKTALGRN